MHSVPILAGVLATALFTVSALPMLLKARRTRDLGSYSIGNIGLANVGNLVQTIYVLSLPPGPIWALHAFQLSTSALMLAWYLRFRVPRTRQPVGSPRADLDRGEHSVPRH
jgi:hypothetical protein